MPGCKIVKVAAVQSAPKAFDLPNTLIKVRALVSEAAITNKAELVVLPEAFCSAYPRFWGFAIGTRSEEQREWFERYVKSSVKIPESALGVDTPQGEAESNGTSKKRKMDSGAASNQSSQATGISSQPWGEFWAFEELCDIAKSAKVHLSIGVIERSLIGSTLWCTNLLFSPTGQLLSKHRKLQPTAAERVVWGQGEATYPITTKGEDGEMIRGKGDNMAVVQTGLGRVGGLICWENFMPLARYVLYKKGVEIYTAPTADARPTWLPVMQHIAQEGRCYVVSANQYHTSKDFPADYPANSTNPVDQKVWSRGGSCIIGPLGEVLAGPLWDEEGILYADLDMDKLHGARLDFDPVGHYGREELLLGLLNGLN